MEFDKSLTASPGKYGKEIQMMVLGKIYEDMWTPHKVPNIEFHPIFFASRAAFVSWNTNSSTGMLAGVYSGAFQPARLLARLYLEDLFFYLISQMLRWICII